MRQYAAAGSRTRCYAGTASGSGAGPGSPGPGRRRRDGGPEAKLDRLLFIIVIGHERLWGAGLWGSQSRQVRQYQGWPSE